MTFQHNLDTRHFFSFVDIRPISVYFFLIQNLYNFKEKKFRCTRDSFNENDILVREILGLRDLHTQFSKNTKRNTIDKCQKSWESKTKISNNLTTCKFFPNVEDIYNKE